MFPTELVEAYPDAKVILSIRDEQSWYDSMMSTLWGHWCQRDVEEKHSQKRLLSRLTHELLWEDDFPKYGRRCFRNHNDTVRNLPLKTPLLEYKVGEGWEPLCKFLGVDVPDVAYPWSDDWAKLGWKVEKPSASASGEDNVERT